MRGFGTVVSCGVVTRARLRSAELCDGHWPSGGLLNYIYANRDSRPENSRIMCPNVLVSIPHSYLTAKIVIIANLFLACAGP